MRVRAVCGTRGGKCCNEFNKHKKTKIAVTGIEFRICIMSQIDSNEFQEETR